MQASVTSQCLMAGWVSVGMGVLESFQIEWLRYLATTIRRVLVYVYYAVEKSIFAN